MYFVWILLWMIICINYDCIIHIVFFVIPVKIIIVTVFLIITLILCLNYLRLRHAHVRIRHLVDKVTLQDFVKLVC